MRPKAVWLRACDKMNQWPDAYRKRKDVISHCAGYKEGGFCRQCEEHRRPIKYVRVD